MSKSAKQKALSTVYDQEGKEIEFDVREDEEQSIKLTQTIELLLAAGYFRARIKGLSDFDKVVGGMTWCITTCNFDVDVDLLFQENSTIGQKIALTEKIVAVLPRMKCPHRIEPHQIQGLDFIHIYPVVQWLVKRAIETREAMGDYIRAYSISQFNKHYAMPQDVEFKENIKVKATRSVAEVKNTYRPQRRYKCGNRDNISDEETRVQSTLLEYGRHHGVTRTTTGEKDSGKHAADADEEQQRRIDALMKGFSETEDRITSRAVGSIVGEQSETIQQMAHQYAQKHLELEALDKATPGGGIQHHQRQVTSLSKQIEQRKSTMKQIEEEHVKLEQVFRETQQQLRQAEEESAQLDAQMGELSALETDENKGVLETLRSLVAKNESLKLQEQQFKTHCKDEMKRLQGTIEELKQDGGLDDTDKERRDLIEKQYDVSKQKVHKIRMILARKNREISALQRRIDEVPTRAELSQYQRRFVELYNQVGATHKETKQFYTLYNTLDDSKLYLDKEVNLLNSIHDNFTQAMSSEASKQELLKQMEHIVEGVKQNRTKLEKKKQSEKVKRDQLNDLYLDLVDKQRLYFKTVKDFQEECRKNEILQSKLQHSG